MKALISIIALLNAGISLAEPVEITELSSSSATTASNNIHESPSITFSYWSGGCSPEQNQVSYHLEVLAKKKSVSESGLTYIEVRTRLHIFEDNGGGCRMAYLIKRTIDPNQLVKDRAAELGLDLTAKKTMIGVSFELPPVVGSGGIYNR